MILNKEYKYVVNGKLELIGGKVSPSNLKRAGVPDELVRAYDSANHKLQATAGNATADNQKSNETKFLRTVKFDALNDIEEFLEDQELRQFGKVEVAKINALFDSDITDYQIEKDTGITRASVGKFKTGKSDIMKMPLKTAIILTNYAVGKGL